jgi:microcystin-dependent protein
MDPYIGQIIVVAFDYAPQGWALCQGQTLPLNQNQALYALLGIRYGGNGTTTFQLPDLRGRMIIGVGQAQGVSGAPNVNLGDDGGQVQVNQVVPHTHPATFTPAGAGGSPTASGTVNIPVTGSFSNASVSVSGSMNAAAVAATDNVPKAGETLATLGPSASSRIYAAPSASSPVALAPITSEGTVSGSITGTASGNISLGVTGVPTGGGTVTVSPNNGSATTVMPPYLALNNIIAINGVYPSRP